MWPLLPLISWSEGVRKKMLIFKSLPQGQIFPYALAWKGENCYFSWCRTSLSGILPGYITRSLPGAICASKCPCVGGNTLSLVCLQEQEALHSGEGHQELADMATSRNSHSEIQSPTSAVFEDQIHV